jgi:ABC-2 type transport system permease protein
VSSPAGVIHDIGYRRYDGPRLGRGYGIRSLYVHSLRTAYGLGRSAGAKVFPWGVVAVLMFIAAIIVAVQSQLGVVDERVLEYWAFPGQVYISLFVLLFCTIAAPALVCRDLRGGVLQLYFSRPLVRSDYPLAKWAALVSAVFLTLVGPLLLLFIGMAFSLNSLSDVWHEFVLFGEGVLTAAIMAALFASISLLISSLSGRRAVASALVAGFFILTTPVLGVLQGIAYGTTNGEPTGGMLRLSQLAFLVSPFTIVQGLADWLFGDGEPFIGPYGPVYFAVTFGIILACVLLTLLRYRKVAR